MNAKPAGRQVSQRTFLLSANLCVSVLNAFHSVWEPEITTIPDHALRDIYRPVAQTRILNISQPEGMFGRGP
jgi:hypothetical protein